MPRTEPGPLENTLGRKGGREERRKQSNGLVTRGLLHCENVTDSGAERHTGAQAGRSSPSPQRFSSGA